MSTTKKERMPPKMYHTPFPVWEAHTLFTVTKLRKARKARSAQAKKRKPTGILENNEMMNFVIMFDFNDEMRF
jgi:hypothetical protein